MTALDKFQAAAHYDAMLQAATDRDTEVATLAIAQNRVMGERVGRGKKAAMVYLVPIDDRVVRVVRGL